MVHQCRDYSVSHAMKNRGVTSQFVCSRQNWTRCVWSTYHRKRIEAITTSTTLPWWRRANFSRIGLRKPLYCVLDCWIRMRVAMETIVFYELIAFLLSRPKMRECPSPRAAFSSNPSSHFKFAGATNVCKISPIHLWRRNIFLVSRTFPLILSCLFWDKNCLNNDGHFVPQSRISHCQNAQAKRPQCICCLLSRIVIR